MCELIEKKMRTARILRIALPVLAALWVCSLIMMSKLEFAVGYPLVMLLMTGLIVCGIVYLTGYMPLVSSVKWLEKKDLSDVANDISLEKPALQRSKIYCGQKAFFCKKPCTIIPYREVAWVYLYERRLYGVIAVEKAVVIFTRDGKKFSLNANADEFKWLLESHIIPHSPDVVLGYGVEQERRYKQLNPEAANAGKKVKMIWGIVLMILGAFLLTVGLINQTIIGPGLVIVLGLLGTGVALFLAGRKK